MIENIKLGLLAGVFALTAYNTYQVSNIDIPESNETPPNPVVVPNEAAVQQANPTNNQIKNNALNTQPKDQNANTALPQNNQPAVAGPLTSVKFKDEIHDFGNVDPNTENKFAFEFKNTGTEPLTISNAKGSCGCTVPNWPKEAIMPGKTGTIDVIFRPNNGQAGKPQEKTVTVTANTNPTNTIVKIKAFVNTVE